MMEALQIKEIDAMIRSLEKELSGVEVKEVAPIKLPTPTVVTKEPEPAPVEGEMLQERVNVSQSIMEEPQVEEAVTPIEEPLAPEPIVEAPLDEGGKLFEELIAKMYDRNYDLGECFKNSIAYMSFNENLLTWESSASTEEKVLLRNNWSMIRMFVQDLFGFETKIKNITKELPSTVEPEPNRVEESPNVAPTINTIENEEPSSMIEDEVLNQPIEACSVPPQTEDEMPMKSSCIAPEAGDTEAAKEKDERTILDEPMVAKALELFSPKKVRVKRKA
jgi:DNA polymerase-3 subunit gamma/tau